jgi:antitoxin PrlF
MPARRPQGAYFTAASVARRSPFGGVFAAIMQFCYSARMKATLTVTRRGVVTLPAKLRQALGIKADDQLIAETTPEGLLLRPAVTLPVEIYSEERIREFDAGEAELEKVLRRRKKLKSGR